MKEYSDSIKEAVKNDNVLWSTHAERERFKDNLRVEEVLNSVINGEIIEEYNNDKPLPSCLINGMHNNKNIHTVIGYNTETGIIRIITVYIPSLERWNNDYKTRR